MAVFSYIGVNNEEETIRGTVSADSPRQARDQLRLEGLQVQRMEEQKVKAAGNVLQSFWRRSRVSGSVVASVVRDLATLLSAGVPLTDALETLTKQQRGTMHSTLMLLRDDVAAGAGLAEAVAKHPGVFDSLCVNMIEVGENAGNLEEVLDQLADFKEQSLHLSNQVITALLYPLIVMGVALIVTLFLMTVVVPMLLANLVDAGHTLPWPTRVLKLLSDTALQQGWLILLVIAVGTVTLSIVLRTERGLRAWHRLLLKLPLFGPLALKQAIGRAVLVIATLLKSGVVYVKALEIAGRSTHNVVIREALEESGRRVLAGEDIGDSLEQAGVFPPMVVQIFTIGQQSGQLEEMLKRLARDYDRQVSTATTRLASSLEPILIVSLAILVGFILFATLLPILEAGNVL